METMKAWVFHEKIDETGKHSGTTTLETLPIPEVGDGEALLKVNCAAICGSDVDSLANGGIYHAVPDGVEWGHEVCGTIVKVGKDVKDVKVGDRVFPFPKYCTTVPNRRAGWLGGFSEYILIEKPVAGHSLIKIDDGVADTVASMIEPMSVGWHAGDVSEPGPGKNAVIFGSGPVGLGAALCCASKGCEKVAVVGRRAFKLSVAKELGFETFSVLDENLQEKLEEYFGKGGSFSGKAINAQCFVEATGDDDVFNTIIPLMPRKESKLAVVAAHHNNINFCSNMLVYGSLKIEGSAAQRDIDVEEVVEMMCSKKFPLEKMVNCVVSQENLLAGVEKMAKAEAVKSIVDYTGKYL